MDIGIIGSGKLANALCFALLEEKQNIVGIFSRNSDTQSKLCKSYTLNLENSLKKTVSAAQLIFICIADNGIERLSEEISHLDFLEKKIFLHTSGACSSELLISLKNRGAYVGSLHPLQTFSDSAPHLLSENLFKNIYYSFEGDEEAKRIAANLVSKFKGFFVCIPKEKKALYHLCASFICNYSVTLSYITEQLFEDLISQEAKNPSLENTIPTETYPEGILAPFRPILEKTLENIFKKGALNSLSGPISRGDTMVVQSHLDELSHSNPNFLQCYKDLGKVAMLMAKKKGNLSFETLLDLEALLS